MEPSAPRRTTLVAIALLAIVGIATRGLQQRHQVRLHDDDHRDHLDDLGEDTYCDAGTQLKTDVSALGSLDLIAEGTNGLTAAVDKVKSDVADLQTAASSATSGSVDDLQKAVDQLSTAVSNLSGGITASSVPAIKTAITNVSSSATAVYDTLKDCP